MYKNSADYDCNVREENICYDLRPAFELSAYSACQFIFPRTAEDREGCFRVIRATRDGVVVFLRSELPCFTGRFVAPIKKKLGSVLT